MKLGVTTKHCRHQLRTKTMALYVKVDLFKSVVWTLVVKKERISSVLLQPTKRNIKLFPQHLRTNVTRLRFSLASCKQKNKLLLGNAQGWWRWTTVCIIPFKLTLIPASLAYSSSSTHFHQSGRCDILMCDTECLANVSNGSVGHRIESNLSIHFYLESILKTKDATQTQNLEAERETCLIYNMFECVVSKISSLKWHRTFHMHKQPIHSTQPSQSSYTHTQTTSYDQRKLRFFFLLFLTTTIYLVWSAIWSKPFG